MSDHRARHQAAGGARGDRPAKGAAGGDRGGGRSRYAVVADNDAAFDFINSKYPLNRDAEFAGLVQKRDGEIIAAIGYDQFTGANVWMHIASDGTSRWMTRHLLHETFKYPFVTCECLRVSAWVEATNHASRCFVANIGFKPEAVLEKAGRDGVDVIIYRMFRRECRYA